MSDRARLRIAFQGELGSFSDEAIQQLYGSDAQRLPYRDFADVTASVASGVADRAVLPIENTMAGSIAGAHDAIAAMSGLFVVAETVVAGVPLLTAVGERFLAEWKEFTGGEGVLLEPTLDAILAWWAAPSAG